eukprot:NODE_4434_length_662_cov_60.138662_g3786_i0.p1 GENE.NODE_4434_length_662_cov_60.138662_g3786_i0~~NODE_4434_length_662_cov_60.138662_g3786_i0.p1  ORF type:complete len:202 (+),score=55.25 NODE_4434_length_662_cov_60.138662_g3786_i0:26-607(+)
MGALAAQIRFHPFEARAHNMLEAISMSVTLVTLNLSILYQIDDAQGKPLAPVDGGRYYALTAVIFVINMLMLIVWALLLARLFYRKIRDRFSKKPPVDNDSVSEESQLQEDAEIEKSPMTTSGPPRDHSTLSFWLRWRASNTGLPPPNPIYVAGKEDDEERQERQERQEEKSSPREPDHIPEDVDGSKSERAT